MKKKMITIGILTALAFTMTACSNNKSASETSAAQPPAETEAETEKPAAETGTPDPKAQAEGGLSGTIVITGSTSVDKILNDMADEFMALNPDVSIQYTGTGSSAGIQDAIDGINTIGVASRDVKEEETARGIVTEVFAYDGIAVAVHPSNTVADISLDNLGKIYSGEVTNWNQIGGKDAPIVVVSREGASGTRSAFEELIQLEEAGGLTEGASVVEGNGNVQTTVAGNENAIGYVSFSFLDDTIKALTIGGAQANADNARAGAYPLSRPFLMVYKEASLTPEAKAFIEFAKSADGQALVEEHGGIKIH